MTLHELATAAFTKRFNYAPSHQFYAPGRVNLIGEHTDYNDGFVLPAAINFGTAIVASKRDDTIVRVCAVNFDEEVVEFDFGQPLFPSAESAWANYVRGVYDTLLKQNHRVCGLDIAIAGDVPYGAGLSSSAALEIVLIRTVSALAEEPIDPTQAALLGQQTENEFIGAHTGIMDQLICARGEQDHALLIDCRDLTSKPVSLDPTFRIVIFNSNVKRGLVDSKYNERRQQCLQAAHVLGVGALRDATMPLLLSHKDSMDELPFRRAHHVISENDRTLRAAEALGKKDWVTMGQLMAESHQSMKQDFDITVAPIDGLVDLINEVLPAGAGGARMTGGGFGGCVVSLIAEQYVDSVVAHVAKHYEEKFGIRESVYICQAVNGAFVA
ncbi:MAG: galactokinase [Reinekea sp.]|nr:galactokinase [Reinekea sp.]